MGFYLKLTTEQANQLIVSGIADLFGGTPKFFSQYTGYIEDLGTGDKYWRVDNLSYDGSKYDVIGFLDAYFPNLERYTYEFVDSFRPTHEGA